MEKKSNIDEAKAKKNSKILLCVGIPLLVIGFLFFFVGAFTMGSGVDLFFLSFLGMPLMFAGGVCIMLGSMRSAHKFITSSTASTKKDYMNYMMDETSDSARNFASNIASGINEARGGGKSCPHCGNINLNDAKYCSQCGEKLSSSKYCSSCGEENDSNAKYCSNCGKRL